MRRPAPFAFAAAAALVLTCALFATGCKRGGSAKLEGHWKGTRAEGVDPKVQDAANAFALATEIVAKGNQITVSTPASKGQQSVYVVDEENKTTLVLHTEKDGAAAKETFVFGDEGRSMTWKLGSGQSMVFTKLKD